MNIFLFWCNSFALEFKLEVRRETEHSTTGRQALGCLRSKGLWWSVWFSYLGNFLSSFTYKHTYTQGNICIYNFKFKLYHRRTHKEAHVCTLTIIWKLDICIRYGKVGFMCFQNLDLGTLLQRKLHFRWVREKMEFLKT